MRFAVIVLTTGGLSLARNLYSSPAVDCDVFLVGRSAGAASPDFPAKSHQGSLRSLTARLWETYRGLVFISAVGIAVRVIAPLLKDKQTDPAVVVVDELGQYAVSLLSGHWGGANELAKTVADVLGAAPVITTATDGRGMMGLDVFARRLGLTPEPFAGIKEANAALVRGEQVTIWCEPDPAAMARALGGVSRGLVLRPLDEMPPGENSGSTTRFVVTSRMMPGFSGGDDLLPASTPPDGRCGMPPGNAGGGYSCHRGADLRPGREKPAGYLLTGLGIAERDRSRTARGGCRPGGAAEFFPGRGDQQLDEYVEKT